MRELRESVYTQGEKPVGLHGLPSGVRCECSADVAHETEGGAYAGND